MSTSSAMLTNTERAEMHRSQIYLSERVTFRIDEYDRYRLLADLRRAM